MLYKDLEKSRLFLTCRPSFLQSKEKLICDYNTEDVGSTVPGVVTSVRTNGALILGFYGNVAGYMPTREAARISEVK